MFSHNFNKKGNAILDSLTIVLIIFVMAIVSVVGYLAFDEINTDMQADPSIGNLTKNMTGNLFNLYPSVLDGLFLMAFILLIIGVLVSVIFLDTHPVFFFVNLILLIIVFCVFTLLGNSYEELMTGGELAVYANAFTYTSFIMSHIMQIGVAFGFILMIALFIKMRKD